MDAALARVEAGLLLGGLAGCCVRTLVNLGNGRNRLGIDDHHDGIAVLVFRPHQKRTRHDLYVRKAGRSQVFLELSPNGRLILHRALLRSRTGRWSATRVCALGESGGSDHQRRGGDYESSSHCLVLLWCEPQGDYLGEWRRSRNVAEAI